MTVYKYFTEERHARRFVERGEMLLRPLSWFRSIEDGEVRGDPRDGVLTYAPAGGLEMNMQDGRTVKIDGGRFVSSARHDEIFVCCFSQRLSDGLGKRFGSRFCVEVENPERIVARLKVRDVRQSELDYEQTIFGNVDYRAHDRVPGADWALPDRLAFMKPEAFAWQEEFRVAVGRRGALDPENVILTTEAGVTVSEPAPSRAALLLKVGGIADFARVHTLA